MATRLGLLMALFSIYMLSSVIPLAMATFHVKGFVYCDTCRAGFETKATFYIEGAKVAIQCKDRTSKKVVFYTEGVTDKTGKYHIKVENDHHDRICESLLVKSPLSWCKTPDPGRSRSSVVLSHYKNGIVNHLHYANSMGYLKDKASPGCQQLLKYYLSED